MVRNIAQNGQENDKLSETALEIGVYLVPDNVVRNANSYNLSAVLSS